MIVFLLLDVCQLTIPFTHGGICMYFLESLAIVTFWLRAKNHLATDRFDNCENVVMPHDKFRTAILCLY